MERETRKFSVILLVTFTLCIFGVLSTGAAEGPRMEVSSSSILWQPDSLSADYRLVVSGAGLVIEQDFKAGESPSLSIFIDGQSLPDGIYTWELSASAVLNDAQRRAMQRARAASEALSAEFVPQTGKTQSGYVSVRDGAFVLDEEELIGLQPKAQQGPVAKDQVILDDLIVDGSACIGFDCVNGESFGFDTIRIKENNLRIRAQDTSSSASFPSNDWQITFNDSANGGANKFSIDDIDGGRTPFTIEAGAPSHSLYVDDGGRLGLGTSTPVVDIHVKSGNTPTLRLEQDGSSGFTPQTWDVAGNEANFFIRDATNGSTLPFRIFPGAPSNAISIEATTGDVGLGTTSPTAHLHISNTSGNTDFQIDSAVQSWRFRVNSATGQLSLVDNTVTVTTPFKVLPDANTNLLRLGIDEAGNTALDTVSIGDSIGASAVLQVRGSVVVNAATVHPDYVFQPDYELPSIESHSEFMWAESHLPGLPKAPEGLVGSVDLLSHQMGILEELETAHIYIEQLNGLVKTQNRLLEELTERLEALEGSQDD